MRKWCNYWVCETRKCVHARLPNANSLPCSKIWCIACRKVNQGGRCCRMHGGVWTAGGKVDEGGGSTQSVGHHPVAYKENIVISTYVKGACWRRRCCIQLDGKSKSLLCRLDLSLNVRSKSSYQDTQAESVISVRRDKCKDVEASEEVFRSSNKGVYG